jgi:hypothetical protein
LEEWKKVEVCPSLSYFGNLAIGMANIENNRGIWTVRPQHSVVAQCAAVLPAEQIFDYGFGDMEVIVMWIIKDSE